MLSTSSNAGRCKCLASAGADNTLQQSTCSFYIRTWLFCSSTVDMIRKASKAWLTANAPSTTHQSRDFSLLSAASSYTWSFLLNSCLILATMTVTADTFFDIQLCTRTHFSQDMHDRCDAPVDCQCFCCPSTDNGLPCRKYIQLHHLLRTCPART